MYPGGAMNTATTDTNWAWSYFNRKCLHWVKNRMVFQQLGDAMPLPKKFGKQVTWLKYRKLPAVTSAGTEGTPPTPKKMSAAQITAAVQQYKDAVEYTDFFENTAVDNTRRNIEELVSAQMAESLDGLAYAAMVTALSGNINYPGTDSALSDVGSTDVLTVNLALREKCELDGNKVPPHKSGAYIMTLHPNQLYNLQTDSTAGGWNDIHKYTERGIKQIFNGEVGEAYGIRFMKSDAITSTSSGTSGNATVYSNFMIGFQPYGVVKLDGYSMSLIIHEFGSAGTADPCDELATIGWKYYGAWQYFGGDSTAGDPDRMILLKSA